MMGSTMQDEQRSMQRNDEQAISPSLRAQRIIEYLEDLWARPHTPSPNELKRITEFVVSLPEEYRSVGLTTIADHFVNGMGLHILDIMATFQQRAEQEGISSKEIKETFDDIRSQVFQLLEVLSKQLSVQSLDSLAALCNITIALYTLSRSDSAEEARSWLYELPTTYQSELIQEKMIVDRQDQERESGNQTLIQFSPFTDWTLYKPNQGYVISGTGKALATELPWRAQSAKLVQLSLGKPAA